MKIVKKISNISTVLLYIFATLVWLLGYIFIGEDTNLNTAESYISFMKFTGIYLLLVMMYIMVSKQNTMKTVMVAIGVTLTPILIVGYMGARGLIDKDMGLLISRKVALLLHILTYGIGLVKTLKHYKQELWINT